MPLSPRRISQQKQKIKQNKNKQQQQQLNKNTPKSVESVAHHNVIIFLSL